MLLRRNLARLGGCIGNLPEALFIVLVILVAVCMAFAFYQYATLFLHIMQDSKKSSEEAPTSSDDAR